MTSRPCPPPASRASLHAATRPTCRWAAPLAILVCTIGPGCRRPDAPAAPEPPDPWFIDVAADMGIDFRLDSGARGNWYFPEIMPGGAAWIDFDNDGWLDLFLVQACEIGGDPATALPSRLFRNVRSTRFEDVTPSSGADLRRFGFGAATGDFDNDGLTDLYVTCLGPNVLLRNLGDGRFEDVTARAGVGDPGWGTSAAFLDYDRDGSLDLFVANYVAWSLARDIPCYTPAGQRDYCGPQAYNLPQRDVLYHNNGDGTFTDVTVHAGLGTAFGNGLGVVCDDFNRDGWPDIYVANDQTDNQLWINHDGQRFVNEAMLRGCALNMHGRAEAGMGVVAEDIDNNGFPDLFMTHLVRESNTVYLNDDGFFTDETPRSGLGLPSMPYTGFGVGMFDLDRDGWLDVFVANGRVGTDVLIPGACDVFSEPNQLFRGRPDATFEDVSHLAGPALALVETSRGAAFADFDNDGDIDILVVNREGPARLLRNDYPRPGNWIGFLVLNTHGSPAIGAEVTIHCQGRRRTRTARTTYSYLCANDPRVHFGLGQATTVEAVHIRWPDGTTTTHGPFAAGQYVTIRQPGAPHTARAGH